MSLGSRSRELWVRFAKSSRARVTVAVAILLAILLWLAPRRVHDVVAIGSGDRWTASGAPPRRSVAWQSPLALETGTMPDEGAAARITPHLTDGGMTLLFAVRAEEGQTDLWQADRTRDGWSHSRRVRGVNTPSDELGPCVSADGRSLYFYSNRPGGAGGFDLYVAERKGESWDNVQNLGPVVNTPAHEYDPALAPDGVTLFFSSNRSAAMQHAGENPGRDAAAWNSTLRAIPGEKQFDLYVTQRASEEEAWGAPVSLEAINRSDSNEGSPFISPDGAFLYFASDRPSRPVEAANLDLYRIRLSSGVRREVENLGPTINTPWHETEPTLSPEGHVLVFSTNREGPDRLYQSALVEVEEQAAWDASHLRGLAHSRWMLVGVAALLVLAAGLLAAQYQRWLVEVLWPARFLAASVLVHVVLLFVLLLIRMPAAIERLVSAIESERPREPLIFEIERTTEQDGGPAPIQVADLTVTRPTPGPSLARPDSEPAPAAGAPNPLPDAPPDRPVLPRRAPAVAAAPVLAEPEAMPAAPSLPRRTSVSRGAVPEDAEEPVAPPPAIAKATPVDPDLRSQPTLAREKTAAPAGPTDSPALPPTPLGPRPLAAPRAAAPAADDIPAAPPMTRPELTASRGTARLSSAALDTKEDVPLPAPRLQPAAGGGDEERASPTIARTTTAPATPVPTVTEAPLIPRTGPPRREVFADRSIEPVDAVPRARDGVELGKAVPRSRSSMSAPGATLLDDVTAPAAVRQAGEGDLPVAVTGIARAQSVAPGPGGRGLPELSRGGERPAAGRVELARTEAPPAPSLSQPVLPTRGRAAGNPDLRPAPIDETMPIVGTVESNHVPGTRRDTDAGEKLTAVTIARASSVGPGPAAPAIPIAPSADAVSRAPPGSAAAAVRDMSRELPSTPGGLSANPVDPTVRLAARGVAPSAVRRAATLDEEAAIDATVATAGRPSAAGETGLMGGPVTTSSVAREAQQQGTRLEAAAIAGTVLSLDRPGPFTRRLGAGELAASAAPGEAPSVTVPAGRLSRTPARALAGALLEDDGADMRSLLTMRKGEQRGQYIELVGGTAASEKAVDLGLAWLKGAQEKDGSWSVQKHGAGFESAEGATGLALLPFLAAGHTHKAGAYRETVAAGVKWLLDHQATDGALFQAGAYRPMYGHGIAAIALCEAWGMTGDEALREPSARALTFIAKAQHAASGGWRYLPNESADTSVVGWQIMALKSGEMAGLPAPRATLDNAARWLASVESNKPVGGQFGYLAAGSTPAMTAEGLLCLQFLGTGRNDPRMRAGADFLMQNLPRQETQTSYYWYYATQVMYHMQGDYWQAWNAPMRDILVGTQVASGPNAGTWDPRDPYELRAGRLYATALKLLTLEVYYRHLPLYDQLGE